METSLKTVFAQIFSCCPKNLSCPNMGGGGGGGGGGGPPPPPPPCPYVYDTVLWEGHSETPDKEILSLVAKFYKIDGEIIGKAEQKMYPSFRGVRGLGWLFQKCLRQCTRMIYLIYVSSVF